jgi:hypothetical protein
MKKSKSTKTKMIKVLKSKEEWEKASEFYREFGVSEL